MTSDLLPQLITAISSPALGYLAWRVTRRSNTDTARIQREANRLKEIEIALEAQKSISDQYRLMAQDERLERQRLEGQLAQCRGMLDGRSPGE